jgi:hypothetical protein
MSSTERSSNKEHQFLTLRICCLRQGSVAWLAQLIKTPRGG